MITATKDQIEEFKNSLLWQDICKELDNWRQGFVSEMVSLPENADSNNLTSASVLLEMGSLSGRIKAVDYLLGLPDALLRLLEDQKEEEKDN